MSDNGSPVMTDSQSVTLTVTSSGVVNPPVGQVAYRVNAGGAAISGSPGWSADKNFVNSGSLTHSTSTNVNMSHASIPAGTPQGLFKTERYDPAGGNEMQWGFDTVAGAYYEVRLYFAETYSSTFGVGKRVFDVAIDGTVVLDNYDVFAEVGANTAIMKSFVVQSDGRINIDFLHVVQNPSIKGIEIVAVNAPNGG